jgi:subtilisin family serine protease
MLIACKKDLKPSSGVEELQSATRSDNPVAQAASDPYASNEVLVKFAKGFSETGRANALAHIGGNVQEKIITNAMKRIGDEGFYVVHTPFAVLQAVEKMKGVEGVEYAEPNYIYTHDATSTDTYYTNGSLWGMYGDGSIPANQYGSQAAEAWANGNTGSNTVYVGIIDEGSMFNHTDLAANFWTNSFDPVDGADNDGNGFIDDVHGWDFDGNNNSTFDGTQDDHGTHVAGTIGAVGGNGTGVAGVCWNVKMISAKFLGRRGGTTANAVKAVDYFTDLKTRHGLNIVATNNSWGGGGASSSLQAAIERANGQNILFIAAAGNDGNNIESTKSYPASYNNANIIAVAAIASNGSIPSWSNYGSTSVDLGAPGSGIYSTLPGKNGGSSYGSYSGTSMATPHVTGAAALYASTHPGLTAPQIKAAILSSVVPTASLSGKTATGGRLNVSGF